MKLSHFILTLCLGFSCFLQAGQSQEICRVYDSKSRFLGNFYFDFYSSLYVDRPSATPPFKNLFSVNGKTMSAWKSRGFRVITDEKRIAPGRWKLRFKIEMLITITEFGASYASVDDGEFVLDSSSGDICDKIVQERNVTQIYNHLIDLRNQIM